MRISRLSGKNVIKSLYPGGPAEIAGLSEDDQIIAVNDFPCEADYDKWLNYFDDDTKTVTVIRSGRQLEFTFPEVNRHFFMTYSVRRVEDPNGPQKRGYKAWIS